MSDVAMSQSVLRWAAAVIAVTSVAACGSGDANSTVSYDDTLSQADVESLDELASRTAMANRPGLYLVEGDMVLDYESLVAFYEHRNFEEKAISTTVVNKSTNEVSDAKWSPSMNIRYCFTTTGWGSNDTLNTAKATVAQAASAWASIARVRFNHISSMDGANCTQAATDNGSIDFVIRPNDNPDVSFGWWRYAAVQEMGIGVNVVGALGLMIHEMGHVLGLDHEQYHSGAGLGCAIPTYPAPEGNYEWGTRRELTAYDSASIMLYMSGGVGHCGGGISNDRRTSTLDGVGIRKLYGNPDWWSAAL